MATCPMPWFPLYASEMLGDEDFISWSPDERGCWITLSARCWADGSIPSDHERMARLCGCDAQAMLKHWERIASKFSTHTTEGRLVSIRIEKERMKAIEKAEDLKKRGKAGAAARWLKDKNEMPKQCSSNARAMLDDATLPLPLPLPIVIQSATPPVVVATENVQRVKKPKGRDYGITALGISDDVMFHANRTWDGWPQTGWNFFTKKPAPRRINRALFLERFQEILTHSPIRKADNSRISAEDLANAALEFVRVRVAEARRDGSEIPNVPCVANFFSSCENEKNPWKDALLAYFGG